MEHESVMNIKSKEVMTVKKFGNQYFITVKELEQRLGVKNLVLGSFGIFYEEVDTWELEGL